MQSPLRRLGVGWHRMPLGSANKSQTVDRRRHRASLFVTGLDSQDSLNHDPKSTKLCSQCQLRWRFQSCCFLKSSIFLDSWFCHPYFYLFFEKLNWVQSLLAVRAVSAFSQRAFPPLLLWLKSFLKEPSRLVIVRISWSPPLISAEHLHFCESGLETFLII
jgi:hypothetical protein